MGTFEFIITLVAVVGGCITAWVYMATQRTGGRRRPVDRDGRYSLGELSTMAESLQERIQTLESILDAEVPNWREQNERAAEHPPHQS